MARAEDEDAKKEVGERLEREGFATINVGGLVDGGKLQQFGGKLDQLNLLRVS